MDKIIYLIETTKRLEKLIINKTERSLANTNIFLINSIIRTNRILISVNSLIKKAKENKYAIYILLRPLVLDYMYFYFIIYSVLKDKDRKCIKEFLDKNSFDNLLDGVQNYRDRVSDQISYKDKETRKEMIKNFKTIFFYAIKSDHSDFNQVLFHSMEKDSVEIKASTIFKKFKNKDSNILQLYDIYSFLSKYDHNTAVSLFDMKFVDNDELINVTIELIHKNFINLLYLVDIENEIDEVKEMIKELSEIYKK